MALAGDLFELILLDLTLPDSQGLATLKEVLNKCRETPVVVLTGAEDDSFGKKAIRRGATDYLFKSEINKRVLIRSIEYAIQRGITTAELKTYQSRLEELVEKRTLKLEQEIHDKKQAEKKLTKALEETQNREREISALLSGAKAVLNHRHFPQAARIVFDICKELTNATAGYVALLSADGQENELLFLEAGGRPCSVDPNLPMPIRGLRAVAYEKGETVCDNDFMNSKWMDFMPSGHVDLDNVLFAPLKINKKTVGIMGLANNSQGFSDNDLRLATAFGEIVSVSLMNSRNLDSLANSRKRFNELFNLMKDGVMILEKPHDQENFKIKAINQAAINMFSLNSTEILGKDLSRAIPAFNTIGFSNILEEVYAKGAPHFPPPAMHNQKSGELWINYYVYSLPTKEIVAVLRDITKQQRAQEELKISEQRHRELIKSCPDPIAIYDLAGKVVDINPAFEKLFGWEKAEVKGEKIDFVPKDQIKPTAIAINNIKQGISIRNFITKRYTKRGDLLELEISATDFKNNQGDILGIVVFFRDITEHIKLERKIRQNEKNLRIILDKLNTGVVMINYKNHVISYANPLALEMIGRSFNDLVGKKCHQFICARQKGHCPITDKGQNMYLAENTIITSQGKEIPVLKSAVCLEMEGQKTILASFQDITTIKQAHADILAKGKIEAAMETAAATCHKLNQPLQAIINLAEAALEDIDQKNPIINDLKDIISNTQEMSKITKRLQNITEYRTSKYSEKFNILDFN
jgi:PAS domain S-box-containing protein